jgi:hypothetical protein
VGGVDGAALGDVDVAAVPELGAAREVAQGDPERIGPGPVITLPPDLRVRPAPAGDPQGVPVGQLPAARVDLGIKPGPDQVTGPGLVAVGQCGLGPLDGTELDQLGLDPAGQVGGLTVGSRQQQDVLPAQAVGQPHA